MSYGVSSVTINKRLKLDKRRGSDNWYARMTLSNGTRRIFTTKTEDLERAKEFALREFFATDERIKQKLPENSRKFKPVAEFAKRRMQEELDAGTGKAAFKDYINAINKYLIPFFGKLDVSSINTAKQTEFDAWRVQQMGKVPAHSTVLNHNAALNRVFDEAELRGWITSAIRPVVKSRGRQGEKRGTFSPEEYEAIYTALRSWHTKTMHVEQQATREVLRDYVLILANTGIRPGKEATEIQWRNITWVTERGERYLEINVRGKQRTRGLIARDRVEKYLDRLRQLNPRTANTPLDELIGSKCDEFVFTTRLGVAARSVNLSRAFSALIKELGFDIGPDNRKRVAYSLRHFYVTEALGKGQTSDVVSKQVGNSAPVLDRHYDHTTPRRHAAELSGRKQKDKGQSNVPVTNIKNSVTNKAFDLFMADKIKFATLSAMLGVGKDGYVATDEVKVLAMTALAEGKLSEDELASLF